MQEVFDRTLTSSNRKLFFDLNPKFPQHYFYTEVLDMHQKNADKYPDYGLNYEHFTLFDNLSLTTEKIRETLRTYAKNTVWYIRDILGKRTNAEGLVYAGMFSPANQYHDGNGPNYELFFNRWYACDYGTTNPFAFLEIIEQTDLLTNIKYYYVENEYYYDSKQHNKQKDDGEYVEDIIKFMQDENGIPKRYSAIIVDPSAASFKVALRKRLLRARETDDVINAKHEVMEGIRLVSSLLRQGRLKININHCPNLLQEFVAYMWDEKAAEHGNEGPVKAWDHCLDALRYHIFTIVKRA